MNFKLVYIYSFFLCSLTSNSQPFLLTDTVTKTGQFQHFYQIYFELGSSDLVVNSTFQLDSMFNFLKKNSKVKIELGVHTDFRGDPKKNLVLSQKRAETLRNYLVDKGISESRIKPIGFGETKPVIEYEDWEKLMDTHRCGYYGRGNRRVTIVIKST